MQVYCDIVYKLNVTCVFSPWFVCVAGSIYFNASSIYFNVVCLIPDAVMLTFCAIYIYICMYQKSSAIAD